MPACSPCCDPRDGGPERTVRARYLVAADGTHSFVRGQLGIGMAGRGNFADCVTIYFKADLRALIGDRNLSVVYVNQPGLLAFFRFSIGADAGFLAVFATFDENGVRSAVGQNLSPDRCAALVRAALGVKAEFPVVIDDVQPWSASAATGDRLSPRARLSGRRCRTSHAAHRRIWRQYRHRGRSQSRVEARHGAAREPPAPGLLDSYETERKPQCDLIVEQAYARYVKRVDPSLPATNLAPMLDDAAIELGSVYGCGAILDEERAAERCRRAARGPAQAQRQTGNARASHHAACGTVSARSDP